MRREKAAKNQGIRHKTRHENRDKGRQLGKADFAGCAGTLVMVFLRPLDGSRGGCFPDFDAQRGDMSNFCSPVSGGLSCLLSHSEDNWKCHLDELFWCQQGRVKLQAQPV